MDRHSAAAHAHSDDGRLPMEETVATRKADREGYTRAMDGWEAPTLRSAR